MLNIFQCPRNYYTISIVMDKRSLRAALNGMIPSALTPDAEEFRQRCLLELERLHANQENPDEDMQEAPEWTFAEAEHDELDRMFHEIEEEPTLRQRLRVQPVRPMDYEYRVEPDNSTTSDPF